MTPKEKAKQLVDRFYQEAPLDEIEFYSNDVMAKQCALIAVDEIIKKTKLQDKTIYQHGRTAYWQDVKSNIHLL